MPSVNGAGSGLDIDALVRATITDKTRAVQVLEAKRAEVTAKQAAFGGIKGRVINFKSVAARLVGLKDSLITAASSSTKLGASAKPGASVGSHRVSVQTLAQANAIGAAGFADRSTTAVASGTDTFQFKVGAGGVVSVAVTASTTLQGLADGINSANGDVTASVVNDGSATNAFRLVLTSKKSGGDNRINVVHNGTTLNFATNSYEQPATAPTNSGSYTGTVAVSGTYAGSTSKAYMVEVTTAGAPDTARYRVSLDGGVTWDDNSGTGYLAGSGAASLGSSATASGLQIAFGAGGALSVGDRYSLDAFNPTIREARDAFATVDGISVRSTSNTLSDAIPGVTLSLNEAAPSESATVTVSRSTATIERTVGDLVAVYNDLVGSIKQAQVYDPKTREGGALLGDQVANRVISEVSSVLTRTIPGATGKFKTLAEIGVAADRNGVLTFDKTKLNKALDADPAAVLQVLEGAASSTATALSVTASPATVTPGTYAVGVTQAAAKASASGGSAMNDTLSAAETLSFTFTSEATAASPTTKSFQVALTAGLGLDQVVSALNTAFATNAVGMSATNSSGVLKLESTAFGADIKFTTLSDLASGANTTRLGNVLQTSTGVDIAGTIGGVVARGLGSTLTGASGATNGLAVSYEATTLGAIGSVTIVHGASRALQDVGKLLVEDQNGPLVARDAAFTAQIKSLDTRIAERKRILQVAERRAKAQFSALDATLGKLRIQGDTVTASLARLQ